LALAKETGAQLHVLYVIDEDLPSRIVANLSETAQQDIAKRLSAKGAGGSAVIHVEAGQHWKIIVQKVRDLAADLIVVGTHKNRGIAELFVGTTLERVAKYSDRPVLLVRDPVTGPYSTAIVGVDFSLMAQHTAKTAAHVAPLANLTLVHAYNIPFKALTTRMDAEGDIPKKERDAIEQPLLSEMAQFTKRVGVAPKRTTQVLREGAATAVLSQEVRRSRADLLVLGVHARSPLILGLLGSTAMDAMSSPPCDVLLVTAPRQEVGVKVSE
jgi:nucleotide-binding universal stress UspA family protein